MRLRELADEVELEETDERDVRSANWRQRRRRACRTVDQMLLEVEDAKAGRVCPVVMAVTLCSDARRTRKLRLSKACLKVSKYGGAELVLTIDRGSASSCTWSTSYSRPVHMSGIYRT